MTTLNTIIEEEIERLRDLYLTESPDEDGAVTTSTTFNWATFDITQKQEKIAYYLMTQEGIEDSLTTAIQRAYEAGQSEERAKIREELQKWVEENSKELSDPFPFDSKYTYTDFVSVSDLDEVLAKLTPDNKEV